VPGDGFPFAVLVSGQIYLVGITGQPLQGGHLGLLLRRHDVDGLEPVIHIYRQVGPRFVLEGLRQVLAGSQVPDVADRRLDDVVRAQETADGLGFGR